MALNFAVNQLDTAAAARKLAGSVVSRADGAVCWLLVDRALVDQEKLQSAVGRLGLPAHNSLANSELAAFGTAAPLLIQLPPEMEQMRESAERFISVGSDAPAFSWLTSPVPPTDICQRLADLAKPKVDQEMPVHCRFADTRVLPILWAALDQLQLTGVQQIASSWHCFDRVGQVLQMPSAPQSQESDRIVVWERPVRLNNTQFKLMLDASEADTIFSLMLDKTPEVVPGDQRGAFHGRLVRFLDTADKLELHQPADRVQFVMLSLTCGEKFYTHPPLQAMWAAINAGSERLVTAMQSWNDATWSALQRYGGVQIKGLQ